jgi:hypothetical protein
MCAGVASEEAADDGMLTLSDQIGKGKRALSLERSSELMIERKRERERSIERTIE